MWISNLRAAGLEDQYTDGFLALLLVIYIYISVTDANNKIQTETTNETDDHPQTLRSSQFSLPLEIKLFLGTGKNNEVT